MRSRNRRCGGRGEQQAACHFADELDLKGAMVGKVIDLPMPGSLREAASHSSAPIARVAREGQEKYGGIAVADLIGDDIGPPSAQTGAEQERVQQMDPRPDDDTNVRNTNFPAN